MLDRALTRSAIGRRLSALDFAHWAAGHSIAIPARRLVVASVDRTKGDLPSGRLMSAKGVALIVKAAARPAGYREA